MGSPPPKTNADLSVRRLRLPDERPLVLDLAVHPHQEDWVPPVSQSLALVDRHRDSDPWVFLLGETPIGFCAVTHSRDSSSLGGFIVSQAHQRKGYGRRALRIVLDAIFRERARAKQVLLTVREGNDPARLLYEAEGFVATERWHRGERVYSLSRETWERLTRERSS